MNDFLQWPVAIGAFAGFVAASVIGHFILRRFTRDWKNINEQMNELCGTYREMYKAQSSSFEEYRKFSETHIAAINKSRIAAIESYAAAWKKVLGLLTTLETRLKSHESANIMERSLVASLQKDLHLAKDTAHTYLMNGAEQELSKTVKSTTSEGHSDEEKVESESRIQTVKEVTDEHQRKS